MKTILYLLGTLLIYATFAIGLQQPNPLQWYEPILVAFAICLVSAAMYVKYLYEPYERK